MAPDAPPPAPPVAPAPVPAPAPATTRELRDRITHYADAERTAESVDPITADTTAKLVAFRNSVRAQKVSLTRMERMNLRGMMERLHSRTRDAEYVSLRNELTTDPLDTGIASLQTAKNKVGEVIDNNPAVKYGLIAAAGVATVLFLRRLAGRARNGAAAVGTAAANGARATGRVARRGLGVMKSAFLLAGVAVLGAVGWSYAKNHVNQPDVTGANPEDARKIRENVTKLTAALRTGNDADKTAALAELSALVPANPTLVASLVGREFTARSGTVSAKLVMQYDAATSKFVLVGQREVAEATGAAQREIAALPATATADQVLAILTTKAGLPAKTDTATAFVTAFNGRVTVGGKVQLVQFNSAAKTFALVEKEKHDKGISDARATLAAAVTYAAPADWSNAINSIITTNAGDLTIQADLVNACAAGKTIAGKIYVLKALGANQVETVEKPR